MRASPTALEVVDPTRGQIQLETDGDVLGRPVATAKLTPTWQLVILPRGSRCTDAARTTECVHLLEGTRMSSMSTWSRARGSRRPSWRKRAASEPDEARSSPTRFKSQEEYSSFYRPPVGLLGVGAGAPSRDGPSAALSAPPSPRGIRRRLHRERLALLHGILQVGADAVRRTAPAGQPLRFPPV